jgi:hypothetical protein
MQTAKEPLTEHISISSITDSNLVPDQKSEELAKAAENLLTANGYLEANETASLALKQNPQNVRAGFIKAMTDIVVVMKGMGVRLNPLVKQNNKLNDFYQSGLKEFISSVNKPELQKIIMDGKEDITSENDLLEVIDSLIEVFERLRVYAKANKSEELTIKAYPLLAKELNTRFAKSCELKLTKQFEYDITCPDNSTRFEVTLNRADFEELQFMSSFYILYFALINPYDLSGGLKVAIRKNYTEPNISYQKVYEELLKNPKFGILRNKAKLHIVKSLGIDAMAGLQWAMSNPNLTCPNGNLYGVPNKINRPGKLFYEGLCISPSFSPFITDGLQIFNGMAKEKLYENKGRNYKVKTNYMALVDNPLVDVRTLGPATFDNCGNLQTIGDQLMGGTFPNRDANDALSFIQPSCDRK